jgi:hypothetical protein
VKKPGPPPLNWDAAPPMTPIVEPEAGPQGGYRHSLPIYFSPRYLQWIVPLALIGVFVLLFFPWVGVIPGGVPFMTQNAWQAAFNSVWIDKDMSAGAPAFGGKDEGPGSNVMMIVYVILVCLALVLAILSLLMNFLSLGLGALRKWRWFIVGGVALSAFVLLTIQMVMGFSLEKKMGEMLQSQFEGRKKAATTDTQKKQAEAEMGAAKATIARTLWFRLAFTLQIVVVLGAILEFWASRRGNRPYPKLELVW